jgi:predicted nucleic acid-binding protein
MALLLNDSSVLLNLLASDCLARIAADTGWQFAICSAVRDEVKRLRDAQTGEMIEIDVTPHIASGLLQLLELTGEEEQTLYVEESIAVDDGEAMSIAIAANRRFPLAIDDKQAANHARRRFPEIQLWSTPEILKHWTEAGSVNAELLGKAIRLIETRARYFPASSHPLAGWWRRSKAGGIVQGE